MSSTAPPVDAAAVAGPATASGAGATRSALDVVASADARHCDNCGATVTEKYCAVCGQRLEPPLNSLWHFTQIAMEDVTHADSRLWRTLRALLFKPGFLTREFLAGRRASYLPPVRLYLVLSVAFFLYASATQHGPTRVVQIHQSDHSGTTASVRPLDGATDNSFERRPGESEEARAQRVCDNAAYDGPWRQFVLTTLHEVCVRSAKDDGRAVGAAMLHSLPRALFVFLPLLAAAMMLMYWRPRHFYVEHLLLFVHNHAFVFLLLLLAALASTLLKSLSGAFDLAVTLYIAWYVFRSMRVVYRQSRLMTLGKLALLSLFYLVSGAVMVALTFFYSALTL